MTEPTPATPEQPIVPSAPQVPAAGETVPDPRQPHDPWSRDAATEAVAVPGTTPSPTAAAPGQPSPAPTQAFAAGEAPTAEPSFIGDFALGTPGAEAAAPRRRRRLLVVSSIVVVILVLAAGGAFAYRAWTGAGITEPEAAVPASTALFARVDVSPGIRDKLSFDNIAKKFPTGKSTSDLVTDLEKQISTSAGLNYDTDVKPWFGGQAGVGLWFKSSDTPVTLLTFASNDDAKAKATMAKIAATRGPDKFGYVMEDGYVLVATDPNNIGSQNDAQAAASAAESQSLADNSSFSSAKSHLQGNNILLAYADMSRLGPLMQQGLGSALGGANSSANPLGISGGMTGISSLALNGALSGALKGTVMVGGSTTNDGVEIRVHTEGGASTGSASGGDPKATVDNLPSSTIVGVATRGLSAAQAKQISTLLQSLVTSTSSGSSSSDMTQILPLIAPPLTKLLESKVISFAFTGIDPTTGPSGLLAADMQNSSDAQSIQNLIGMFTGGTSPSGLNISANGARIQATLGNPGGGKLSSSSLYTTATSGMSGDAAVGYIDIQSLLPLVAKNMTPQDKAMAAPVKAVAFGETSSGNSGDVLLRVIIK